jgi:DNA replication protein DnaC
MIGSLLSPDFVTQGQNVIFWGKPGRGKTHLAIALAYRAIQNGFDARFTTAAGLIEELTEAGNKNQLQGLLNGYVAPHVVVVDEVGYLTYGSNAANVLFHVVNARHLGRRAMIFTTNKGSPAVGPSASRRRARRRDRRPYPRARARHQARRSIDPERARRPFRPSGRSCGTL